MLCPLQFYQGSVLSPLLFIIVMEAILKEFCIGCPWELLYADDLAILSDDLDNLKLRLTTWKEAFESKGLRMNVGKTKIMSSTGQSKLTSYAAKWPCGVCEKGVGANSICCIGCRQWVHKKCSGVVGPLKNVVDFECKKCRGLVLPLPMAPFENLKIENDVFEKVASFRYIGDTVGQAGGCIDAVIERIKAGWGAFRELLPVLTNRSISLKNRGNMFRMCIRKILLYGSETWATTVEDMNRISAADNSMVRWICNVRLQQKIKTQDLCNRLGIPAVIEELRSSRLHYYGHLVRMDDNTWPKAVLDFNIPGSFPIGRPKLRWKEIIKKDMSQLGLNSNMAFDRNLWRAATKVHTKEARPIRCGQGL